MIAGLLPLSLLAQSSPEIGIFAGTSAYNGELQQQWYSVKQAHPAVGLLFREQVVPHLNIRLGFNYGKISGNDKYSKDSLVRLRNLNFQSTILDFDLMGEYEFLDIDEYRFTPYVFAGLTLFHFDPYTYDTTGRKEYLQPLSTEGQGIAGYNRQPYSTTQVAIPFGAGVKFALTENVFLGLEVSLRKTFTDYLDDVSSTYVDQNKLLAARGAEAVELAFRTNELPGHQKDTYPPDGTPRGNPNTKDWYYFTGITLSFRLGSNRGAANGGSARNKALRALGCPTTGRK